MSLTRPKKRYSQSPDPTPRVWERVVAFRKIGKQVQDFMVAWVLECHMLDEYHAMKESLYGEDHPVKYFEATDVILEVVDKMSSGDQP